MTTPDPRAAQKSYIKEGQRVTIATLFDGDDVVVASIREGTIKQVLTKDDFDLLGIRVRITNGTIGHVQEILDKDELSETTLRQIINNGETMQVEFKETFKTDSKSMTELKCLRDASVKAIAAFMNTKGGKLIIGVDDSRNIIGLEPDYKFVIPTRDTQSKQDKLKQEIHSYVKEKLGDNTLENNYQINFYTVDTKEICVINVVESSKLIFVDQNVQYNKCNSNKQETTKRQNYFLRTDSGVQLLDTRELINYCRDNKRKL